MQSLRGSAGAGRAHEALLRELAQRPNRRPALDGVRHLTDGEVRAAGELLETGGLLSRAGDEPVERRLRALAVVLAYETGLIEPGAAS